MVVADIRSIINLELMLPLNGWFGVVISQIINVVVYKIPMIVFGPSPTDQFGLSEICYLLSIEFDIHCDATFLVCFQVSKPYFAILTVP